MAVVKKILIEFFQSMTIPAVIMGTDEDKQCLPFEPVLVPFAYGENAIHDKFAQKSEEQTTSAPKAKSKSKAAGAGKRPTKQALEKAHGALKIELTALAAVLADLQTKIQTAEDADKPAIGEQIAQQKQAIVAKQAEITKCQAEIAKAD